MRLMKHTAPLSKEECETVKAVAEITTLMMRMEQNKKNGGKDEVRMELCMKKIRKLYQ